MTPGLYLRVQKAYLTSRLYLRRADRNVHKSPIGHSCKLWPLPALRDLTCDGRLSTYDESVLKLSKVTFRGENAQARDTL